MKNLGLKFENVSVMDIIISKIRRGGDLELGLNVNLNVKTLFKYQYFLCFVVFSSTGTPPPTQKLLLVLCELFKICSASILIVKST